ncbi:FAD-binding protein [bacterium]|nr:FAD-binding protein [bacterium]
MPNPRTQMLLRDDLRDVVRGDLVIGEVPLGACSTDAGVWERQPLVLIAPRDSTDVLAVLSYAAEHGIAVHPRGAGLGVTAGCLGRGIVLDCSRHLRRVIEPGPDFVTVEAGITVREVRETLAQQGRRLQGLTAEADEFTIGGWLSGLDLASVPAESGHWRSIKAARLALSDGSVETLTNIPLDVAESDDALSDSQRGLYRVAHWHGSNGPPADDLDRHARALANLTGLIDRNQGVFRPQRVIAGSRGTLGLLLETTLATVPLHRLHLWVVIGFDLPERAADESLNWISNERLELAEILDWRSIALASDSNPVIKAFFPEPTPAALCLRFSGDDETELKSIERQLHERFRSKVVYLRSDLAASNIDHPLSNPRKWVRRGLAHRHGAPLPRPVFDALTVPPEAVAGVLSQLAGATQNARLNVSVRVAPLTGRIVLDPLIDPTRQIADIPIASWLGSLADIVDKSGGTLWGVEPWMSRIRSSSLSRRFAGTIPVWREVKAALDVAGVLNPEVLPGLPRTDLALRVLSLPSSLVPAATTVKSTESAHLRLLEPVHESTIDTYPSLPILEAELDWPEDRGPQLTASACNSCGACRSLDPSSRMCPSFRGDRSEASSPRALAGLLRQVTSGTIDPTLWGSEQLKEAAEACFHCRMCRTECQAGVDISALMIEAKAAAVESYGLAPKDFWLSRVDTLARLASFFPVIANAILSHGQSRWLMEKVTGLSRHRRLPRVRRWSFIHRAEQRGWSKPRPQLPGPRVALFLDILANHFDQELAETTVEYLKWAGVNVYVPARQRSSGMPALVVGDLERARELVRSNLRILGNAVRDGFTIVCIEPTSAMVLRDYYPRLTDDLDAALVAENTLELSSYLAGMNERGLLPPADQALHGRIGYHQPCHLRAMNVGNPGFDLVRKVPGVSVEFIDQGCSGIAGPFGFARSNFRKSLRIGYRLRSRLKGPDIEVGMTECLSCRMQMEQGLTKRSHHPVEILAMASGLKPDLRAHWNRPKPRNIIT